MCAPGRGRIKYRLELINVDTRIAPDPARAGDFLEGQDIAARNGEGMAFRGP
jgi:hypothetical protein